MLRIFATLIAMCASVNAWSVGRLADVEIVDRDTGATLPVYRARNEYWVAGTPGARYAVQIRNQRSGRILAVTSVDGVNVISGETAAWNQTGYVFEGGQAYSIDGWRKSNREVAQFNFTALPESYAARTGRAGNVGVIGVAVFLERPTVERYAPPSVAAPAAPAIPSRSPEPEGRAQAEAAAGARDSAAKALAPPAAQQIGTGHGAREVSYASDTEFERLADTPNETVRIRYDRYENLVAMGIVRVRPPIPPTPDPFPESGSTFVPDPPGGIQ